MNNKIKNHLIIFSFIFFVVTIVLIFDKVLEKPINKAIKEENYKLRKEVLSNATSFEETERVVSDDISFIPAYDGKKVLVGYVAYWEASGFASKIEFLLGIDLNGKITGLKILDASKETQGLGTKIQSEKWQNLWKKRDSEYEFNKKIDGLSGATITPKGVYIGIKKVLNAFESIKPEFTPKAVKMEVKELEKITAKLSFGKDKKILMDVQKIFSDAVAYDSSIQKINGIKYILAYDVNNKKLGYFTSLKTEGIDDYLSFDLGIDMKGKIIKLKNMNIGNNSPDYNSLVLNKEWQSKWIGRDKFYNFNESLDSEAGASTSPKSIYQGIKKALSGFDDLNKESTKFTENIAVSTSSAIVKETPVISLGTDRNIMSKIKKIFPTATAYDSVMSKFNGIKYILAYDADNKKLGYFASLKTEGVSDNLTFDLGIGLDGKIVRVSNVDIGNNSSDYNGLVLNKDWQARWSGRDKSYKFNDSIDSEAGASISPNSIYDGIKKALNGYDKIKGGN